MSLYLRTITYGLAHIARLLSNFTSEKFRRFSEELVRLSKPVVIVSHLRCLLAIPLNNSKYSILVSHSKKEYFFRIFFQLENSQLINKLPKCLNCTLHPFNYVNSKQRPSTSWYVFGSLQDTNFFDDIAYEIKNQHSPTHRVDKWKLRHIN